MKTLSQHITESFNEAFDINESKDNKTFSHIPEKESFHKHFRLSDDSLSEYQKIIKNDVLFDQNQSDVKQFLKDNRWFQISTADSDDPSAREGAKMILSKFEKEYK